jgi:hypothetical protein
MGTLDLRYSGIQQDNIMKAAFINKKQPLLPEYDFGYTDKQVHKHRQ